MTPSIVSYSTYIYSFLPVPHYLAQSPPPLPSRSTRFARPPPKPPPSRFGSTRVIYLTKAKRQRRRTNAKKKRKKLMRKYIERNRNYSKLVELNSMKEKKKIEKYLQLSFCGGWKNFDRSIMGVPKNRARSSSTSIKCVCFFFRLFFQF